jgi:hypothetical protein
MFDALANALQIEGISFENGLLGNTVSTLIFLLIDGILYPIFGALGAMIAAAFTRGSESKVPAAS